jgi:serine/threonine-protein kinase
MPDRFAPDAVLAGKYVIRRRIADGGMGRVYEAEHKKLGQRVAIKILRPDLGVDERIVARFEREARAAARLESPYVTRILDVDTDSDGLPYMVMEFLRGRDLGEEARILGERKEMIAPEQLVEWMVQACTGLEHAHRQGIIHRDIKPSNIFLAEFENGRIAKVLDFGISKNVDPAADPGAHQAELTETNAVLGTPYYMSPEQLRGLLLDGRSDLWSLGVTMYRALTGKLPFEAPHVSAYMVAAGADPPIPIASRREGLPPALSALIMEMLAKNPDARPGSAAMVAERLRAMLRDAGRNHAVAELGLPRGTTEKKPPAPAESTGPADAVRPAFLRAATDVSTQLESPEAPPRSTKDVADATRADGSARDVAKRASSGRIAAASSGEGLNAPTKMSAGGVLVAPAVAASSGALGWCGGECRRGRARGCAKRHGCEGAGGRRRGSGWRSGRGWCVVRRGG